MTKIFISQGSLNLGRNRDHRKLEAKLDGSKEPNKSNINCPYLPCPATQYCYSEHCLKDFESCNVYKFKERYKKKNGK